MWLTSLSLRRPMLIVMALLTIMLGGVIAYRSMAVELVPNVKIPVVAVSVTYPGAGPREVESRVTRPVENAVASTPGLKTLRSTSGDGYSLIIMEFRDGLDPNAAAQDVERRISLIRSGLPDGVKSPSVLKFSMSDQPILVAGVNWDRNPPGTYQMVDNTIRPRIEAVEGVSTVQLFGGNEREIRVSVDRGRLEARGLALAQVTTALAAANLSMPGGFLQEGDSQYSVRVYGLYQELEQLGNLVLSAGPGGGIVRLADVATIEDGFKKQTIASRINGHEGVALLVQEQQMANTVAVSQGVQKALRDLGPTLPAGVEISIVLDVVVYAPLAFSSGMTAQFFKQFSGAVVTTTLFSLLVSFTLTPMLASRWLSAGDVERSPLPPVAALGGGLRGAGQGATGGCWAWPSASAGWCCSQGSSPSSAASPWWPWGPWAPSS